MISSELGKMVRYFLLLNKEKAISSRDCLSLFSVLPSVRCFVGPSSSALLPSKSDDYGRMKDHDHCSGASARDLVLLSSRREYSYYPPTSPYLYSMTRWELGKEIEAQGRERNQKQLNFTYPCFQGSKPAWSIFSTVGRRWGDCSNSGQTACRYGREWPKLRTEIESRWCIQCCHQMRLPRKLDTSFLNRETFCSF